MVAVFARGIELNTFQTYGVRIIIPVIFIVIGIIAARLGRKDGDTSPLKNTMCVGTSVILMSLSVIITDGIIHISSPNSPLAGSYWVFLLLFIFLIFYSIDNDRYASWERDGEGNPTDAKKVWAGIVIPNFLALVSFVGYQSHEDWWS